MMLDQEQSTTANLSSAWGVNLEAAVCEHCDWSYLLPQGSQLLYCPNCFQARLTLLAGQIGDLPYHQPPELYLPFTVTSGRLSQSIENFASGIWFAPSDLNPQNLQARLQRIYLPMWLVDSDVQAIWQAEAGFNYEAVSHQDQFDENRGGWVSQRVTETRIRWESRLGRLTRPYHNIAAPALEEHNSLRYKLGRYNLEAAQPYQTEALSHTLVRLPNRLPDDAWPDAVPPIQTAAADECRRACQADHVRDFRWKAEYHHQNWTLLLLPVYMSYYLDDEEQPQPVLIHGQSGQLSGPRRASMKRAQQTALIIVAVAVTIFILSLMAAIASFLLLPPLLVVAGVGLVIALMIGLLAVAPLVAAWQFNRRQKN